MEVLHLPETRGKTKRAQLISSQETDKLHSLLTNDRAVQQVRRFSRLPLNHVFILWNS